MKYSNIGGQAVMEGIMMKNGDHYAVAVRKPDKEIEVKVEECHSFIKNKKILQLPFIRGVFNFVDSLVLGMKSLMFSAEFFMDDEEEEKEAPQESAEDFESWDADLDQGDITETDEETESSDDAETDEEAESSDDVKAGTIQDTETDTKADVKADTDAE